MGNNSSNYFFLSPIFQFQLKRIFQTTLQFPFKSFLSCLMRWQTIVFRDMPCVCMKSCAHGFLQQSTAGLQAAMSIRWSKSCQQSLVTALQSTQLNANIVISTRIQLSTFSVLTQVLLATCPTSKIWQRTGLEKTMRVTSFSSPRFISTQKKE